MSQGPLTIDDASGPGVRTLRLNRPDRLNALNPEMLHGLIEALDEAEADVDVRVVVITGEGRAFCAGGDVKGQSERIASNVTGPARRERYLTNGAAAADRLRRFRKPVVASINGLAVGAGLNLALLCDIRIAADSAWFSLPFVDRGITHDWFGETLLPSFIGLGRALEMTLTARRVSASEAHGMGLVDRIVDDSTLTDATTELARAVASKPPLALQLSKRLLRDGRNLGDGIALELEALAQAFLQMTDDHAEAASAFLERRDGDFQGR